MDTFIIRLLPGDPALRGVLRRVADGSETTFADDVELVTLLNDWRQVDRDETDAST